MKLSHSPSTIQTVSIGTAKDLVEIFICPITILTNNKYGQKIWTASSKTLPEEVIVSSLHLLIVWFD